MVLRPGGNPRVRADWVRQDVNVGGCTAAGCTPGSTLHKTNTNTQTDLRTPVKSKAFFLDGIYEINPSLSWRTNLMYNDRDSSRTVAGYPMQAASFSQTVPGMSAQSYFNPTTISGLRRSGHQFLVAADI